MFNWLVISNPNLPFVDLQTYCQSFTQKSPLKVKVITGYWNFSHYVLVNSRRKIQNGVNHPWHNSKHFQQAVNKIKLLWASNFRLRMFLRLWSKPFSPDLCLQRFLLLAIGNKPLSLLLRTLNAFFVIASFF